MKKICLIVLVFLICLTLTNINVSAQEVVDIDDIIEIKGTLSKALSFGDTMRKYFPNVAIWIEEYNYYHTVDLPLYSETQIEIEGETYLLLYENLLPGGSYQNFIDYADEIFTENIARKATTQAYLDNSQALFYTSNNGDIYISSPASLLKYYNFDNYTSETLELIEVKDGYAIGRICLYVTYMEDNQLGYELFCQYPAWIECRFVKTDNGWKIDESAFTDMITSISFEREYCSIDNFHSPSTADPAFDSFVILPVISIACLVPATCLLRRRRRTVA